MTTFPARNGRKDKVSFRAQRPGGWSPATRGRSRRDDDGGDPDVVWIWGVHAASAAWRNPARKILRVVASRNAAQRIDIDPDAPPEGVEIMEPRDIDRLLPDSAVHQGLAVECRILDPLDLSEAVMRPERPLVILDQVTDPQNIGAIWRSAAAFGAGGVVLQTRKAPVLGGVIAKAAAGAVETLPEIRCVNISRAIGELREAGWKVVGLAGEAEASLSDAFTCREPLAIVLGAEGDGLRAGVADACTQLARIPIGPAMESLNVSNAAAIAFYEAARTRSIETP